jgi:hypothetical protein
MYSIISFTFLFILIHSHNSTLTTQTINRLTSKPSRQTLQSEDMYSALRRSVVGHNRINWDGAPRLVRLRVDYLRAIKNKLHGGQYAMMVTLYDRLGGHPIRCVQSRESRSLCFCHVQSRSLLSRSITLAFVTFNYARCCLRMLHAFAATHSLTHSSFFPYPSRWTKL